MHLDRLGGLGSGIPVAGRAAWLQCSARALALCGLSRLSALTVLRPAPKAWLSHLCACGPLTQTRPRPAPRPRPRPLQGTEEAAAAAAGLPGGRPPSTFASVSLGLSRAAVALHRAFHQAALRAPPRRSLTRPAAAAAARQRTQ